MSSTSFAQMHLRILGLLLVLTASLGSAPLLGQTTAPQTSAGAVATPAPPRFRMIQATAGTKSVERDGRLIILDPRNVFHLTDDHKVMVEFEWDGPPGPHKFQGVWKDPSGKIVIISDFDFKPQASPFAGYFTMLMDETAATGVWTLEARIDGETAGSYSFEIISGAATAPPPAARVPLTAKDVYRQAQAATVFVEKLDASGKEIGRGSGFVIGASSLLTAFGNIDGASGLRIIFLNGQASVTNQVVAWDRLQDWAVLSVGTQGIAALTLPGARSWNISDRCYSLGTSSAGGRVIVEGAVVGDTTQPRTGERLTLSFSFDPSSIGGPVLNEYGEAIGMLGGNFLTGPGVANETPSAGSPPMAGRGSSGTAVAVPIELIKIPPTNSPLATLADLAAKGLFIPPLRAQDQVSFGELALSLDRKGGPPWPRDARTQFSHSDGKMVVFIYWQPTAKFKGVATLRFYDLDNRALAQSSPMSIKLKPGVPLSSFWTVPLADFSPGTYRADLYLGDLPAWRGFFRVLP